ncbi:hypothetical protein Scep_009537 [Stephania cephalantha]|uniref:Glyoxalase At5g48480-like C-terminal domain-containing protein n=1 Tax=Stephania cephalantha TaxID=152367 RepID=A0AAP0PGD0_9MAGN
MHTKRKVEQSSLSSRKPNSRLDRLVFIVADHSEGPPALSGGSFWLETNDVEGAVSKAVKAGAIAEGEIAEGENVTRVGRVKDPYGYVWLISSAAATMRNSVLQFSFVSFSVHLEDKVDVLGGSNDKIPHLGLRELVGIR